MQLEFSGAPTLALPRETVWRHLVDPETLASCTPDARDFRVVAPGRYSATCAIGAGRFRIHVALDIELHDLAPPASVRWRAHGVAPGSTLEVNTTVHLEAQGGGHTHLAWRSAITAHGMIARLGRGLVEETLRQFTDRFWHNIADRLATLGLSGAVRLLPEQLLDLTAEHWPAQYCSAPWPAVRGIAEGTDSTRPARRPCSPPRGRFSPPGVSRLDRLR
jgi:carbon monoxide dehydrogenase subunit G